MVRKFLFLLLTATLVLSASAQDVQFEGLKEINGTHLFVKVIGKGEPVLVIHGGPGLNYNYFLPHLEPLAKKYQLIFYDQRSAGQSDLNVRADMTIKQFTDDIEAIRKEFKIDQLNILCHSWSSIIAASYLIAYPDHVKSVIFCDPSPLSREFDTQMNSAMAEKTTSQDSLARLEIIHSEAFKKGDLGVVNSLMKLNIKTVFCDTSKVELFDPKLPENYLVASLSLQGLMGELKKLNMYDTLTRVNIKSPILIIAGNCDIIPAAANNKLAGCFANAQIQQFPNSGHYPFIEENELFIKTVSKFLKKVK